MKIIGLTGGIASGKSTVAGLLHQRGVPVVDADEVARTVVEPGKPALVAIRDAFGEDILLPDGSLDRQALGDRVFRDPAARQLLENITHPLIAEETARRMDILSDKGHSRVIYEAALLVEAGRTDAVHVIVVVAASPEHQIERLVERDGLTQEEAEIRLAAQMPLQEKLDVADHILENDGDLEALKDAVDTLLQTLDEDPNG